MGHVGVGWGESCRGVVGHAGGRVGHDGVGHVGVVWVMQGWGESCRVG